MRLTAISDSHGRKGTVFDIIEKNIESTDYFLCLGDCRNNDDFEEAVLYFGNRLHLISVCGNTDWSSAEPEEREFLLAEKRILMCHGHTYNVKAGYYSLMRAAQIKNADLVFFGHTHQPHISCENGIYLVNPGTASLGYYAVADIKNGKIECKNEKL